MTIQIERFRSGHKRKGYRYEFFLPNPVNEAWQWNAPLINQLVEKAALKLGELNSYARLAPDIDRFIQLHVTKEAVVSSRIEGTSTELGEAVLPEEEISPERRNDWREVSNYITAMNEVIKALQTLPLSSRVLKLAHKMLLSDVRGEHKLPGEFRSSQNWIGGNSLSDAVFIPPAHEYVPELMGDLEKFLHNSDTQLPTLVKTAIAHYQFETIHPFLDGNGRIGRLLITAYLVSQGVLDQPLLYLSSYFGKNRGLYYDNLMHVRTESNMLQWLKYFLVGVEQISAEAVDALHSILELKADTEKRIQLGFGRRAASATVLLHELFKQPVLNIGQVASICGINFRPANELVALLCQHNILREITGQSRNRLFAFIPYLRILDDTNWGQR